MTEVTRTSAEARSDAEIAARLRDSEARYRVFAEATGESIVIHDNVRIIDANDNALHLFGYTLKEAIGRRIMSFLPLEERAAARARLRSGDTRPYEAIGRRRDGTSFPFEISARVIEYQGKPARVLVLRDLIERKRTEAALRRSAEEFRAIFESSPVGAAQADPTTWRLQRVNAKFCEITGYTADELLTLTFADLIHPEDRETDIAEWHRMVRGEVPTYDREKRYVRKDGTALWVRATVNVIRDAAGHPVLTSGIIQDIDAATRTQKELQQAKERAEAAERELARSRLRLSHAIEVLPEGFALFDADDRLVLYNSRYRELYAESADLIVPGVRFEDMLRKWLLRGQCRDALGREEEWLAERLASHREPRSSHEQRLTNGRWLRVEERRTADGDLVGIRIDITGLKRREMELRELTDRLEQRVALRTQELADSEARFRSIVETLPYGIVSQDRGGTVIWANPAAEQILGFALEQMRGRTSQDPRWEATDDAGRHLAGKEHPSMEALRTGATVRDRIIGVLNPRLHEQRWLRVTAVPQFRDGEPEPHGVYTLFGDITEGRRAETALRESEARFRNMADSAPVMIWMTAPEGPCVFVSKSWCEFTGRSVEESLGFCWVDTIHPDDCDEINRRFREASLNQAPLRLEYRLRRSDGVWRWVLDVANPRRGEDGTFLGYIGSVVDITERRQQEEELRRLAERQAAILDALPANVAVLDADGTILAVNQAWQRFGVENGLTDPEACVGRNYLEVCRASAARGDADAATLAAELKAVLDGKRDRIAHDYPCHTPGEERWFRLLAAPFGPDLAGGAVIVHLDVTEARTIERALHQAQKMESIGQLTGGIAHDFNNLLTAVIGNLELLKRYTREERASELLKGALAAAERGATLTQRLLAFARRQRLEPEALDIAETVAGLTELLARSVGPRVRITASFPSDLWPVQVDPNQFELVLINLAVNARDAMPEGGALSISARNEDLGETTAESAIALPPGEYVRIAVTDTGQGMPPEVLARAAEPFFTTKEVGKGSGLGLAMAHGVAAQSGGTLRILSTLKRGTTVEIWLPRAPKAAVAAKPAGPKPPPRAIRAGTRVLVIDDDPEVRDFMAECLRTAGCSVTAVASGAEGLACLDRHSFDAVVTDFAMPGMTGLEVAAAARTKHPDLPIAVITGYADARTLNTSDFPVLYKPFSPDELTECVSDLLVRERETMANGNGGPVT